MKHASAHIVKGGRAMSGDREDTSNEGGELLAKVLPGGGPLLGGQPGSAHKIKPGGGPVYDGFGRLLGYIKYNDEPKRPDRASGLGTFEAEL